MMACYAMPSVIGGGITGLLNVTDERVQGSHACF